MLSSYTAMGTYVLFVTLATIFVIVLVARQRRTQKDVAIWFMSGLVGILLGAAGAAALTQLLGYDVTEYVEGPPAEMSDDGGEATDEGGGGEGGGMGMMGMGGGGPGGMGMGMGRGPSPKRQLTMLVRKVDLLTGDIALNLTDEQSAALAEILGKIKSQETMTDDEASALNDEILALLDEDQKAKQDAVGLPFRRGARGGSPGGRGGGSPGGAGGGPGGEQSEDANPFTEERNAGALNALLERFGKPAADATAPDAEPKDSEAKDAEPAETGPKDAEPKDAEPEKATTTPPETPKE